GIGARYIVTGFKGPQPTNDTLCGVAERLDQAVFAALAKQGLPVRDEKFRPEPQRGDDLGKVASRVLVHLFLINRHKDREVGAMSRALGLHPRVIQYHLDCLRRAKLANMTDLDTQEWFFYWDVTSAGRRYVIEQKLVE